jgi:hypothetical protein
LSVYEESDPPGDGAWVDYLYDFSGWDLRATKVR